MKTTTYSAILLLLLFVAACGGQQGTQEAAEDTAEAMGPAETMAEEVTLEATLTGDAQVPGPGDEDGTGTAEVTLTPAEGTVCFEMTVENVGDPQAAHIHEGAAGESGSPVVDFDVPTNGLSGCVDAEEATIQSIIDSPSNYYVNIHNAEFGGGAVRGQL